MPKIGRKKGFRKMVNKKKGKEMQNKKKTKDRSYTWEMKGGINRTKPFAEKGLAEFAVNVGTKCGHGCTYCSSGAILRMHDSFLDIGENPFGLDYSIVDPNTPQRVAADAARKRKRGMIQLCTTVDAWSPEAQKYDVGRRCLDAILAQSDWTVRILTKNAAIVKDFDLIKRHKDRVLVGLTLTGTPSKTDVISAIEPNASPLHERFDAMRQAHKLGLRTYAMLCPMMPGIADGQSEINELIRFAKEIGAEEIFAEAVNARGPGLKNTEHSLREAGFEEEARSVGAVRKTKNWSPYAADLVQKLQVAISRYGMDGKLRYLLYPKKLNEADRNRIRKNDAGIVWLGEGEANVAA
jgi:DNA repair photolyase